MMTTEQLRSLLKLHGWWLVLEPRRKQGKRFAIAKRRQDKRLLTRYIKAENKFDELTEADVLARIDVTPNGDTPGQASNTQPDAANE